MTVINAINYWITIRIIAIILLRSAVYRSYILTSYIRAKSNDIKDIYDYSNSEFEELGSLSGVCLLAAEAEDYKVKPREFPCKAIVQLGNDKKSICPLFMQCGAYEEIRNLINADVWIGTSHSILLSNIPAVIDPYGRTYYEAFHDLLDVIFIDEVDSIQKTFDSIFVPTFTLVGDKNQLLDKFKLVDQTISSRGLARTESRMYTWAMNLKHLETALLRTLRMVSSSKTIESYLTTRTVTSNQIFSELKSKLERESVNEKFIKNLESYLKYVQDTDLDYEFLEHDLYKIYDKILKVQNMGVDHIEIEKLIKQELENFNVVIPQNEKGKQLNKKLIYQQFEFFIYLVQIDFWVRILNKEYPYIKEKIGDEYENLMVFEGISKALKSFISEPMTGVMFGYKFVKLKDMQNTIRIELVRYNGVGRSLLENWHQIKKFNGQTGPATVMFSGTSYAPGSPHYNLNQLPTWILKSSLSEGEIYQKFLPKSDSSKNGELIKVSGIDDYEKRNLQLRKLAQLCINDFENELKHWRLKGENRKVLIIVNSYDNCMEVAEELEKHKELQGRFKVLTNETNETNEYKEYYYQRELLEYFSDTNADILVAPLIVIERGYNILIKNSNKSYFGSVFFLIRPYMTPGDLDSQIQILHANLPEFIKRASNKGLEYGKAIEDIRKNSFMLLSTLYSQKNFWNKLKPLERKIMSWFTLIPVKQTIGRLQRGGTDCRVFYVDGAFAPEITKGNELNRKKNMLRAWEEILCEQEYDVFARELYGSVLLGLKQAIREIDEELEDSETEY